MALTHSQRTRDHRAAVVTDAATISVSNVWIYEGGEVGITNARNTDNCGDIVFSHPPGVIPTTYPTQSTEYSTGDVYGKTALYMDISDFSTYPRC